MIHFLNEAGRQALAVASAMFWQTAVLVLALLLVEFLVGRRMRASLRCGLWLLVITKLCLPPSLKSPVSPGYWIGRWIAPPLVQSVAPTAALIPKGNSITPVSALLSPGRLSRTRAASPHQHPAHEPLRLNIEGALLSLWALGALALAFGVARRNRQVRCLIKSARPASGELSEALRGAAAELGLRRLPELRLTQADHSPAVSGLLNPVIVLPAGLATCLSSGALRDVLLHELVHIRRRDLWLNIPQALAQVVWWWNPFVWLANARIRLLREQAVDEQVLLLNQRPEESTYPSTLVAVARYCADRPVLTLSFVGILESRHHLRSRVERLLDGPLPPRAGLGRLGWLTLVLTACLALPMAFARRVDASGPDPGLSSRQYRIDADRLMTALEEQVSYTVDDFVVEDLPSNHGGDYPEDPGTFSVGAGAKQRTLETRTSALLGKYFTKAGVTFPALNPRTPMSLQKAFAVDAASGTLVIRATDAELSRIDAALRSLSLKPDELQSADPNLPHALTIPASGSSPSATPGTLRWLPWSEDSVGAARQKGQTVLVDFTAKWCLTCRANRVHVLNDPRVRERLAAGNVVTLTADYTHENPGIAEELRRLNRPGIPAVVIYPSDPNAAPLVLPEQLSVPIVLDALPEPSARRAPGAPASTLTSPRPADQIQIRIFELDPKNGSMVLLESAEFETHEQILSGITSKRRPGDAFIDPLHSSKRLMIAELVRPAPSGQRIDISFAEANLAATSAPNTAALDLLPVVRPGETTVDLFVVLRRSPEDPVPVRRSATLKPGESLVIVTGYPVSAAGTKPLLFAMTPSVENPAHPAPEKPAPRTSERRP